MKLGDQIHLKSFLTVDAIALLMSSLIVLSVFSWGLGSFLYDGLATTEARRCFELFDHSDSFLPASCCGSKRPEMT